MRVHLEHSRRLIRTLSCLPSRKGVWKPADASISPTPPDYNLFETLACPSSAQIFAEGRIHLNTLEQKEFLLGFDRQK